MPPRRNKENLEQLTEFERGRIIGLREGGILHRAKGPRGWKNSSTVMRIWKQWTDEHQTTRKTGSGRWKAMSVRDDRHLLHMAVKDHITFSRQLTDLWSTTTSVLMSASSIRRSHIHVRRYAVERYLQGCVSERHSGLTPEVMVWGVVSYHGRSNLLRIECNLNSNSPTHTTSPMPYLFAPDMSPIEHVCYLVGWCLTRDPRPAASEDELLLHIQAIWNPLPQADIQNPFDSKPRCIAAFIAARGGYSKY
ncbi:uncharacterized protein TNCV_4034371 [Trichonephila clavipes]|nr:uncharacterized protein TNCV_4034371 [Trichonephila clavipes]